MRAIDATCPLVTKVHLEAVRFAREGYTIILIGHEGHDEVLGTTGEAPEHIRLVQDEAEVERLDLPADARLAYLTQTTLSVDDAEVIIAALKRRFPHIVGPSRDDICYATQNRQEAVKELVPEADAVIVLGSQNSSNSLRLAELARASGKPAYLVDGIDEIPDGSFTGSETVLITAGASAPKKWWRSASRRLQGAIRRDGRNAHGPRGARQLPPAARAARAVGQRTRLKAVMDRAAGLSAALCRAARTSASAASAPASSCATATSSPTGRPASTPSPSPRATPTTPGRRGNASHPPRPCHLRRPARRPRRGSPRHRRAARRAAGR